MDIKAPLDQYATLVDVALDSHKIKESIDIIVHSGIKHEFRTTVLKSLCQHSDLCEIRQLTEGSQCYRLQNARVVAKILDEGLVHQRQYSEEEFVQLQQEFEMNIA